MQTAQKLAYSRVIATEMELRNIKARFKLLNRQTRQAAPPHRCEQIELQKQIVELEKHQRHQRQRVFEVEDEIIEKRNGLIFRLELQMTQQTEHQTLFTIRWRVA